MNWMPVLPDELFSHRAPRAPSALARAAAQGSSIFSCLLPCSRLFPALASPSCQACEQGGLELGAAFWGCTALWAQLLQHTGHGQGASSRCL